MKKILLVPIQTDGLYLAEDTLVTEATADFTRLPYFNGQRDVNADVANISENIVSQPLQDQTLRLRRGLHLHWALPDAMNRGRHLETGKTMFPTVPNRWLVTRILNGKKKHWVVESDYLFPEEKDLPRPPKGEEDSTFAKFRRSRRESITVPVKVEDRESAKQPFRYMGRKVKLEQPTDFREDTSADRYPNLTTVGYGEPSFAAFYPNCHSVFGFHDEEINEDAGQIEYDIIGWYSNAKDGFFTHLINETVMVSKQGFVQALPEISIENAEGLWSFCIRRELLKEDAQKANTATIIPPGNRGWREFLKADENTPERLVADYLLDLLRQHVEQQAGWALPKETFAEGGIPEQTLLFSRIVVNGVSDKKTDGAKAADKENNGISVVIGNTGTEALSAYLGSKLDNPSTTATTIEERLEALYLLDKLDHRLLDVDAKFDEARHENGFKALAGGHLWTVSVESSDQATDPERQPTELPEDIALLLRQTNSLQASYDKAQAELEDMGTQLFADWYKYMMSTYPPQDTRTDYPDIDEVRYFIQEQVMKQIEEKKEATGTLVLATPSEIASGKNVARGEGGAASALAKKLARSINKLATQLVSTNLENESSGSQFVLKQVGGPRYYQPTEPVVLLVNDREGDSILQPTNRHGNDGRMGQDKQLLDVYYFQTDTEALHLPNDDGKIWDLMSELVQDETIGFNEWKGQPWNPFRLDWEVELVPLGKGTNIEEADYSPRFLTEKQVFEVGNSMRETQYFHLPVNEPDLEPHIQSEADFQGRNPNIYVGKSLLTPQAKRNLTERLESYISQFLKEGESLSMFLDDEDGHHFKHKIGEVGTDHLLMSVIPAYIHLKNENVHVLSQSLSGFNDALLQLRQTYQLPITDPIGFLDYQPFTEEVKELADNSTHLAPQPLTDFNPIRNGKLIINQLRLIDTFGQMQDIDLGLLDRVRGSGPTDTTRAHSKIEVPLQPRLAQPARLHFRWRSADEGLVEMNAHPKTSPICGWLLTNQLDDSLVVYDADGQMLGSIEAEQEDDGTARWNPAPGANSPVFPNHIPNPFLKKMVKKIQAGGVEYVGKFLDMLDKVLSTIEPEEFESQQALSLLIGRPVALVRASLSLELQGTPAVDQGWKAFYDDREEHDGERKKDGFTQVEFPVRLGKADQYNDGMVGYWLENENAELDSDFHFNCYSEDKQPGLQYLDEANTSVYQSIDAEAQLISMLIDPRGKVHVTSGILPVKEVSIPPDQYLPALQKMGTTFLTAPLLTPAVHVQSLLPTVEKMEWSWLERNVQNWREVLPQPTIDRGHFLAAFSEKMLQELERASWVRSFGEAHALFNDSASGGHFTELVDEYLFDILENISTPTPWEDGSINLIFETAKFHQKIIGANNLGDRVWNLLVRSDVRWCQWVPDRPETFLILPEKTEGRSPILPEYGLESIVWEILKNKTQTLTEPRRDAHFKAERITIREGYLKLKNEA